MKKIVFIIVLALLVVGGSGLLYWRFMPADNKKQAEVTKEEPYLNPFINFTITKKTYPVTYTLAQATDILLVINKKHSLPADYVPALSQSNGASLRAEALDAYKKLLTAARQDGITLTAISSYRSYSDQERLFNEYVRKDGQAKAETYSARPGHSEHQSGLAVDIGLPSGSCNLMICMAETKEGRWLANHAHEYGYIIRYQNGKEAETGYQFEPWHIRYVGLEVAKGVYESGFSLDAYFGITAGDYVPQATAN